MKIKLYFLTPLFSILIIGCSNPDFKQLNPGEQNGIIVEANSWRGTFDPAGGFTLRIINVDAEQKNCEMIFDDKYRHTFEGLQNEGKGMVKDSIFRKGDTLSLTFSHEEVSTMLYFNINEENYRPKTLRIKCSSCDALWQF